MSLSHVTVHAASLCYVTVSWHCLGSLVLYWVVSLSGYTVSDLYKQYTSVCIYRTQDKMWWGKTLEWLDIRKLTHTFSRDKLLSSVLYVVYTHNLCYRHIIRNYWEITGSQITRWTIFKVSRNSCLQCITVLKIVSWSLP